MQEIGYLFLANLSNFGWASVTLEKRDDIVGKHICVGVGAVGISRVAMQFDLDINSRILQALHDPPL